MLLPLNNSIDMYILRVHRRSILDVKLDRPHQSVTRNILRANNIRIINRTPLLAYLLDFYPNNNILNGESENAASSKALH